MYLSWEIKNKMFILILQISIDGIHLQFYLRKPIPSKLQKYTWITKLRLSSHRLETGRLEEIDFVYIAELALKMNFIF